MPDFTTDPWIEANSPLPFDKLHAIGVINVRWNRCELWLILLLAAAARMSRRDIWAFVHDLGDIAISSRVETFARFRGHHPYTRELISNALAVYDVCRQNRNCIVHAWTFSTGPNPALLRRSKRPIDPEPSPFPNSVDDLRRVADETYALWFRLSELTRCLQEDVPLTSLEKLRVPALLWTPPQSPKEPRRRQRPSTP
jgi:hypothetical protein